MICVGCPRINKRKRGAGGLFESCRICDWGENSPQEKEKNRVFFMEMLKRQEENDKRNKTLVPPPLYPKRRKRQRGRSSAPINTIQIKAQETVEIINERDNERYSEWRDAIRRRDRRTCILCGSKEWIQVHHVERWSDNHQKRYNLENGVCLCIPCHCKHHGPQLKAFPEHITDKLREYIDSIYRGKPQ